MRVLRRRRRTPSSQRIKGTDARAKSRKSCSAASGPRKLKFLVRGRGGRPVSLDYCQPAGAAEHVVDVGMSENRKFLIVPTPLLW